MDELVSRSILIRFGGLCLAQSVESWMGTLDYRAVYKEVRVDPIDPNHMGSAIFLFWHEYLLAPFYLRPYCQFWLLVSQHRDAELLSQAAKYRGFETVRGSTNRGGFTAIRTILDRKHGSSIAITPDGPKGPRRQIAPGCIFLASKLQIPLVLVGIGYDRPWRIPNAWDQFAVPRPCSRVRALFSEPIYVPAKLPRLELEEWRKWVELSMTQLTTEAESWAEDRIQRCDSIPLYRQSANLKFK